MEQSNNNDNGSDNDDEDFDINEYRDNIDSDDSYESIDENDEEYNNDEYIGPILPGGHRFDRKFLCVKYPGVVQNPEKAIETLGGLGALSAAFKTPTRRLELRFRPQDGYCKPTCGDRHQTTGFLLRVRVKKSRVQQMEKIEKEDQDSYDFKGPYDLTKLEQLLKSLGKIVNSDDTKKDLNEKNEDEKMKNECSMEKLVNRVQDQSSIGDIETEPSIQSHEILYSKSSDKFETANEKDVTVNHVKKTLDDLSKDENYQVPTLKVIGRVETEFDFQNLCDFQFLPIGKSVADPNKTEDIYESVYPVKIPAYSWLKNEVPYFLPPPAFSRMLSVQQFSFKAENDEGPKNLIGKTRKSRKGFANFINFHSPETPFEPPPGIEAALRIKFLQKSHLDRMREIFEERPIWSKNALMSVTNFTAQRLKFLLPSVAYYFMTGPWRIMWVKLGYDPRKDPQARKYQTLDYRVKAMHGLDFSVRRKRTPASYTLPYKTTSVMKPRTTVLTVMQEEGENQKKDQLLNESSYIYREGFIPPSRQIFYQYCDIHIPQIQAMLAKLPDYMPPGVKCHEKRGWLPSGFSDQCREIINRQVRAVLRKRMNIPEDLPTALPPKRPFKTSLRFRRFRAQEYLKNRQPQKRKEPDIVNKEK